MLFMDKSQNAILMDQCQQSDYVRACVRACALVCVCAASVALGGVSELAGVSQVQGYAGRRFYRRGGFAWKLVIRVGERCARGPSNWLGPCSCLAKLVASSTGSKRPERVGVPLLRCYTRREVSRARVDGALTYKLEPR